MSDHEYEIHPLAEAYPMMQGTEWDTFVEDIRVNGILNRIALDAKGRIVDGRNRYKAARLTGQKIKVETNPDLNTDEKVRAFIESQNDRRRHLTKDERRDAIQRMHEGGKSLREIAKAVGVSKDTVARTLESVPTVANETVSTPKPQSKRLTEEQEQAIAADTEAGESVRDTAAKHDVSPTTVQRVKNGATKSDEDKSTKSLTPKQRDELETLFFSGERIPALAKKFRFEGKKLKGILERRFKGLHPAEKFNRCQAVWSATNLSDAQYRDDVLDIYFEPHSIIRGRVLAILRECKLDDFGDRAAVLNTEPFRVEFVRLLKDVLNEIPSLAKRSAPETETVFEIANRLLRMVRDINETVSDINRLKKLSSEKSEGDE